MVPWKRDLKKYAIPKLDVPSLLRSRATALLGSARDTVAHTFAAGGVVRLLRQFQCVFSYLPGRCHLRRLLHCATVGKASEPLAGMHQSAHRFGHALLFQIHPAGDGFRLGDKTQKKLRYRPVISKKLDLWEKRNPTVYKIQRIEPLSGFGAFHDGKMT